MRDRFLILFLIAITCGPSVAAEPATTQSTDLPQPRRVNLKLDNTPAAEALRQLFDDAGLRSEDVHNPNFTRPLAGLTVTADIIDQPFMLALLEICRQTGLEPTFTPMQGRPVSFTFRGARRPGTAPATVPMRRSWMDGPVTSGGPLVFIAGGVTRRSEADLESGGGVTQSMTLAMMALRDPGIRLFGAAEKLVVDEAIDEAGRSLRIEPSPEDRQSQPRAAHDSERLLIPITVPLAYTEESQTLKRLRGRLNTAIVTKTEPVEIIRDGKSIADQKQAGKLRFTIGKLEETGQTARLAITVHDYPPGPDVWNEVRALTSRSGFRVLEPPDARYWIEANIHSHLGDRLEGWVEFRPLPAGPGAPQKPGRIPQRVVWDAPVEVSEVAVPVEFTDLPLPARKK